LVAGPVALPGFPGTGGASLTLPPFPRPALDLSVTDDFVTYVGIDKRFQHPDVPNTNNLLDWLARHKKGFDDVYDSHVIECFAWNTLRVLDEERENDRVAILQQIRYDEEQLPNRIAADSTITRLLGKIEELESRIKQLENRLTSGENFR
jgi:hypothetical protein